MHVLLAMLITISGMVLMLIVLMMIAYHVLDPVVQHAMEVVPALLAKMDTIKAERTAWPVIHHAIYVVATLILVILAMLITISGIVLMMIVLMMIAYHVLDPVVQHAMEVVPALLARMDTTKTERTAWPVIHHAIHVVATLILVILALAIVI